MAGTMEEEKQLNGEEKIKLAALVGFLLSCLQKGGFFNDSSSSVTQEDTAYLLERSLFVTGFTKDHVQSVFYSQGSIDKSKLWEIPRIPVKEFALAVYSDFAVARNTQTRNKDSAMTADKRADVILGYHKGTLFLQSLRDLKSGHTVNLQNLMGAGTDLLASGRSAIPPQLANMISYKCDGNNCTISFPLPEKTSENLIVCPLDECGAETNIWSRRKRIVELRRDHEAARGKIEGISGQGGVKGIDEGVKILRPLIDEWDTIVSRPNKDITTLEQDLTKALLLKHIVSEQEFLKVKSW